MKIRLSTVIRVINSKTSWGKEQLKIALLDALARDEDEENHA